MERKDEKSEEPTMVNAMPLRSEKEIHLKFGAMSSDNGEVDRIQCLECGTLIANSYEKLVVAAAAW